MSRITDFRARLRSQDRLLGTFSKTPSPIVHEVLGLSPLDCVCIDAEHAPFGRSELDLCLMALRAADMPSLVRVPHAGASEILNALDCGATGIVVPHVLSESVARAAVQAAHYGDGNSGNRGYAGSTRAARYATKTMPEHLRDSGTITTVIAQIEDAEALGQLDAIAAVQGIDCLFVGRMDLTMSLGAAKPTDPPVLAAVEKICAVATRHHKAIGMFVPPSEDPDIWRQHGATFFLLASDQQFLLDGARALATRHAAA